MWLSNFQLCGSGTPVRAISSHSDETKVAMVSHYGGNDVKILDVQI